MIIFVFKNTDKLKIIRVKVCTANLHSIAHHTHSPVIEANPSSDAVVIGQSLLPIKVTGTDSTGSASLTLNWSYGLELEYTKYLMGRRG